MSDYKEDTLTLLGSHNYLCLSTVGEDGLPWTSPLYFGASGDFDLYFVSRSDAQHSANIRANGRCSGAIFDGHEPPASNDGLQFSGHAYELSDDAELEVAIKALYDKRYPDPEVRRTKVRVPSDFQAPATRFLYRVAVERWYKYDTVNRTEDRRVAVELRPGVDALVDRRPAHLKT